MVKWCIVCCCSIFFFFFFALYYSIYTYNIIYNISLSFPRLIDKKRTKPTNSRPKKDRYLKHIDTYPPTAAHISAFLTPSGARFLLLHQPPQISSSTAAGASSMMGASLSASTLGGGGSGGTGGGGAVSSSSPSSSTSSRASSSSIAANPTSPQTEEAIRQFMNEVYELWVKTVMNPFYRQGVEIRSSVFRSRVVAAGRKWL